MEKTEKFRKRKYSKKTATNIYAAPMRGVNETLYDSGLTYIISLISKSFGQNRKKKHLPDAKGKCDKKKRKEKKTNEHIFVTMYNQTNFLFYTAT